MRDFEKNPLGKNERISYDDLYELYITRNLSVKEIMAIINRSQPSVEKCLRHYGIKKDLESTRKNISKGWKGRTDLQKATTYDKRIKTCRERYGVDFVMQNKDILNKALETTNRKYGGNSSLCDPTIRQKGKETCLRKYGTEIASKSDVIREKIRTSHTEKLTKSISYKLLQCPEESKEILWDKDKFTEYVKSAENKTLEGLAEGLGCSMQAIIDRCHRLGLWSIVDHHSNRLENQIRAVLQDWGIECYKTRQIINPYELDIYCPEYNIAIEVNGSFWHSDRCLQDRLYHKNKTEKCEKAGVFLFHIFEHEWLLKRDLVISRLRNLFGKNENKIYARKCEVRKVPLLQEREFLNNNHFQGYVASKVCYGLYYNDMLVSVMSFTSPRFNTVYDWELLRYCSLDNTSVVGGASKLFKAFTSENSGSCLSYSDYGKNRGTLYKTLGFTLQRISEPNYIWINCNTYEIKTRYQCQMKDERKIMTERGYVRIFDSGNCVWTYNPSKENFLE